MSEGKKTHKSKVFKLPNELIGSVDLNRIVRELEALDDFLYQSQIRKHGTPMKVQRSSRMLEEIAANNGYSLLEQKHRTHLIEALKKIQDKAPSVHISFAVEPTAKFSEKIVGWMRENIHQYLLVEIGLQPAIAVGCVVRTDNQIFDMSLRHKFAESRSLLIKKLSEKPPSVDPALATPKPKANEPSEPAAAEGANKK